MSERKAYAGTWQCKKGHKYHTDTPVLAVTCGPCSKDPSVKGKDYAMTPVTQ